MNLNLPCPDQPSSTFLFSGSSAFAAENHGVDDNSFEMLQGVIVDPVADRLYLMNPHGGINAVGLASGNLLWTSAAAGKPLAAYDDRLAAQAEPSPGTHSLPIVFLNTRDGGRVESTIAIQIPAVTTPPSIDDRMGASSLVNAGVEQDGLLVRWTVTSRRVSPIPRPVGVQTISGAALINLRTYQAVTLTGDDLARAELRGKISSDTTRLSGTEGLYFPPQPVGRFFVSVKLGPSSAGQPAVMKRWSAESGEPLPEIELGPGFIASLVSADKSLVLIVTKTSGRDHLWSFYAIATGQRFGEVRLPESTPQPFFVWHSILITEASPDSRTVSGKLVEEPLRVRGIDLKTGSEIWTRPLRDTSYRGSYPPHP
jgi:hypothetical protein